MNIEHIPYAKQAETDAQLSRYRTTKVGRELLAVLAYNAANASKPGDLLADPIPIGELDQSRLEAFRLITFRGSDNKWDARIPELTERGRQIVAAVALDAEQLDQKGEMVVVDV